MAIGPGSSEGFGEQLHWSRESRMVNADRDFLLREAAKRAKDARSLVELRSWINNKRRTSKDGRALAKRWGVEIPREDPRG